MASARNPAKEALGEWRALPATLPRAWYAPNVTPYARFIGLELFRRCDDNYQGIVVTNDPWTDDVCRSLEIGGSHRNAAKAALRLLVKVGLVRPLKGRLFVEMGQKGSTADAARTEAVSNSDHPPTGENQRPDRSMANPPLNHGETMVEPCVNQQSSQPAEIIKLTIDRVGKEREGQGREGSRAREDGVDSRLGPMPPHAAREFLQKQQQPSTRSSYEPPKPATPAGRMIESIWTPISVQFWLAQNWEDPGVYDALGKLLTVSAAAGGSTFESLARCALYRFAVICHSRNSAQIPALKWLFQHGKLSKCLHEGADSNPPAYKPISRAERKLEAAE